MRRNGSCIGDGTGEKESKKEMALEKIKALLVKAAEESKKKTDCQNVAAEILRFKRVR